MNERQDNDRVRTHEEEVTKVDDVQVPGGKAVQSKGECGRDVKMIIHA